MDDRRKICVDHRSSHGHSLRACPFIYEPSMQEKDLAMQAAMIAEHAKVCDQLASQRALLIGTIASRFLMRSSQRAGRHSSPTAVAKRAGPAARLRAGESIAAQRGFVTTFLKARLICDGLFRGVRKGE
jgi:hypothetical protein